MRYHHIFDPETGYPASACIASAVALDNSTQADILSTVCFVLGADAGTKLFNEYFPNGAALTVTLNEDTRTVLAHCNDNMQSRIELAGGVQSAGN